MELSDELQLAAEPAFPPKPPKGPSATTGRRVLNDARISGVTLQTSLKCGLKVCIRSRHAWHSNQACLARILQHNVSGRSSALTLARLMLRCRLQCVTATNCDEAKPSDDGMMSSEHREWEE